MKVRSKLGRTFLVLALGICTATLTKAANHPLSADDVTLLLIGGSSPQRMVQLIEQRGISFKLNPDLVKQFYQDGATDEVIDALQRASAKVKEPPPASASGGGANTAAPATAPPVAAGPGPTLPRAQPGEMPSSVAASTASSRPVTNVPTSPAMAGPSIKRATRTTAQPPSAPPSDAPLPDPSPAEIQHITQTFAAKEKLFKEARDNYTYHQINRVETLDSNDQVDGVWEQDWDILFDQNGGRIERVTYAPESTLKGIIVTEEDLESLRNIQPFVLTTDELPEYDVRYLGHVHVDYITAYVFDIRPKEIKKNHVYFKGIVWVDDHDLQIVKAEGRTVPELRNRHGQNLFPRFSTWRQQIDGKYWFPTFTKADDTLYFDQGPVHIIEIIKYTDYKQFKSKVRILSATPVNPANSSTNPRK